MVAREALALTTTSSLLSGDAPLISPEPSQKPARFHLQTKAAMTLLSAMLANPTGYGV